MWDYILTFMVGAAVPIFNNHWQRKDDRKKFELERKDKYKLAAIDKKLKIHQQAYIHWYHLNSATAEKPDNESRKKVIVDANNFWIENNLYLESKTRNDFVKVIDAVRNYPRYVDACKNSQTADKKEKALKKLEEIDKLIGQLGNTIQMDIQLEPITLEVESNSEGT